MTKGGIRGGGGSKAEVHFPEEVMTVTTHPPCTIEIPSVESEWVVIGGVGRGEGFIVYILASVCTCTYVGVLWGAHSYSFFSSLYLVPTQ